MPSSADPRVRPDHYEGLFDETTRLPGVTLVRDRIAVALARAERNQRHILVAVIEMAQLDPSDQELVATVAGRIRSAIRVDDTAGRLSETEFVIVCSDVRDEHEAMPIVERAVATVSRGFDMGEPENHLVSRIGTTMATPPHEDPMMVLDRAHRAMFAGA